MTLACQVPLHAVTTGTAGQVFTPVPSATATPVFTVDLPAEPVQGQVVAAAWKFREDTPIPRESRQYHPYEEDLLFLINQERSKVGAPPLTPSLLLTSIARAHSSDMADNDFFSHNSQGGATFQQRIKNAGYHYKAAAENLFAGNGPYNSPEAVIKAWMASANHRSNLLNPAYTEVGIGYRYNPNSLYGGYYTADFGSRSDSE